MSLTLWAENLDWILTALWWTYATLSCVTIASNKCFCLSSAKPSSAPNLINWHWHWWMWEIFALTHWGRDQMDAFSQTTCSRAFSWMKMFEFRLKFHWRLFLRFLLTILQHWFRLWLGADQATSHYLNQWWIVYWRIYASLGLNELIYSNYPSTKWYWKCRLCFSLFWP